MKIAVSGLLTLLYAFAFVKLLQGSKFTLVMVLCLSLMTGALVTLVQTLLELSPNVHVYSIYICFFIA